MDPESKKLNLIEWLGFKQRPAYEDVKWLGPIIGVFLTIVFFACLIAAISLFLTFLQATFGKGPYADDVKGDAIRNVGLVLAAFVGAPFIVWRTVVAAKQAQIADEALFNDKINVAAQGLLARRNVTRVVDCGENELVLNEIEDDLVARVAAIDRLAGLALEREKTSPRIARLLAAYIRGNFPCENLDPTEGIKFRKTPRIDLQTAIDNLSNVYRVATKVDRSRWRLNLRDCDLDGVNFYEGYFWAADFSGSRLEAAIFAKGNFEGGLFFNTLLNNGEFRLANFKGARLDRAILNRPEPVSGGLVRSINMADITGVTFIAADISAMDYLGSVEVISKTFGTEDTILSDQVMRMKPASELHSHAHLMRKPRSESKRSEKDLKLIEELESTGFQNWSPYDSSDMSTGWHLQDFREELGMNKWPFEN